MFSRPGRGPFSDSQVLRPMMTGLTQSDTL
jgi:hypothetical protein